MANRYIVVLSALNFCGLLVLLFLQLRDTQKIVYIDSSKVLNNYQGMIDARAAYQSKVAQWKANIDTLATEIEGEIVRYSRESAKMTGKEKELSEKLIQTKRQQYLDYQKAISEKASQEDAQATQRVVDEINAFIKKHGEENGYTIVLAATEYGNIAFARDHVDITGDIIDGLNSRYKGSSMK